MYVSHLLTATMSSTTTHFSIATFLRKLSKGRDIPPALYCMRVLTHRLFNGQWMLKFCFPIQ